MKNKLINQLISENYEEFNTYFLAEEIENLYKLNVYSINKLLSIKNKKIRFECISAITHPLILNENYDLINYIISLFHNIINPAISNWLHFAVISPELLKNSKMKYRVFLKIISNINESIKASHICNIFWNPKIVSLEDFDYLILIFYCLSLNNDELDVIENNLYEKKDFNMYLLLNHKLTNLS